MLIRSELAEVTHMKDGHPHGYEWWVAVDGLTVSEERHWQLGQLHGIERSWNHRGRLRRGYPRYWNLGLRLRKREYTGPIGQGFSLPSYRADEDDSRRNSLLTFLDAS